MEKRSLITASHFPRIQYLGICRSAFNGLELDHEQTGVLLKRGGDLKQGIRDLITNLTSLDWYVDQDGTIYFEIYSTGRTGWEWIEHFVKKGIHVSEAVRNVLLSNKFEPTKAKRTNYHIAVLKGHLFKKRKGGPSEPNILAEGEARSLQAMNLEAACILRDTFTDKQLKAMGLRYIMAMHEPCADPQDEMHPFRLTAMRRDLNGSSPPELCNLYSSNEGRWMEEAGFAFIEDQFPRS